MRIPAVSCALTLLLCSAGCTFGLEDQVQFVARDLVLRADLEDGEFVSDNGTVAVGQMGAELEDGAMIVIDGTDSQRSVRSELAFTGNLGALCPGAVMVLQGREGDVLRTVDATGAPPAMLDQLSAMQLRFFSTAVGGEGDSNQEVELSAQPGTDGFNHLRIRTVTQVGSEQRRMEAEFDLARVVEEAPTPGWEGDTWEGQPIQPWE